MGAGSTDFVVNWIEGRRFALFLSWAIYRNQTLLTAPGKSARLGVPDRSIVVKLHPSTHILVSDGTFSNVIFVNAVHKSIQQL